MIITNENEIHEIKASRHPYILSGWISLLVLLLVNIKGGLNIKHKPNRLIIITNIILVLSYSLRKNGLHSDTNNGYKLNINNTIENGIYFIAIM